MPHIRIESIINKGGFGEVFRAVVVEDGSKVAVKRLAKPYTYEDARRFIREVRITDSLDHPNIVNILFENLEADPPTYVMPLAECNLGDILQDLRQNEERRGFIYKQILEGIAYAHEKGVIHRDIKPQNILILKDDHVLIADFGCGRFTTRDTTTITVQGESLGTIMYAAPEQLTDIRKADNRSDIYGLGKILYEMLTSRPGFPVPNLIGLEGKYLYIIQKCIDIDPDKRYQTVKELADDFELLVQRQLNTESPTDLAIQLLGEIVDPDTGNVNTSGVRRLVRILMENTDDKTLYINILPRLTDEIIDEIIQTYYTEFLLILYTYDEFITGYLDFSYCDRIANFYEKIFLKIHDFSIRKTILCRLLTMGYSHNRWHVRDVLARIIYRIDDPGLAKLTVDVFRGNSEATKWSSVAIDVDKLHSIIRDGIREINKPSTDDDEIPF